MYVSGVPVCVFSLCLAGRALLALTQRTPGVSVWMSSCCSVHATFQQTDHVAQDGHLLVEQLAGIEEITVLDDLPVSELEA